jgi:tetratricopeptide (TPR) repeat protein
LDVLTGILIFLACMGLPYLYFYRLNPYRRNLKKGIKLYNQEKYAEAIEAFNNCLKKYPDDINSLLNRAYCYAMLNDYNNAETDIVRALALKPDKLQVLAGAGKVYSKLKNYSHAISFWDAVINIWPDHSAFSYRGTDYLFLNKYDLAIADLTKAISLKPDYLNYSNRAFAYLKTSQFEKAIADSNESIKLNANNPEAYDIKGFAYANLKNFKKAFEGFEKSHELNSNNAYLYKHRGIAYFMAESFVEAEIDLKRAIELDNSTKEEVEPYLKQIADKSA